jgi:uncharacterized protein (TIGR00730 family)
MSPARNRSKILPGHQDPEFMAGGAARPLRILAEYIEPFEKFRRERVSDTIVIFGSARLAPRARARAALERLQRRLGRRRTREARERLRTARQALAMSRYYEDARELSRRITAWARTLSGERRRFVVCSGGGPGIMEAANRGAREAGGVSVGLNIELPHEQEPNPYIPRALCFQFHYFFMRKLWFAQPARALIVFPGGFGTMDELWEMLTLMQTGKLDRKNLILIYGRKWWRRVINFRALVAAGTISEADYRVLEFADTVDEAFSRVRSHMQRHHLHPRNHWWE